jgi:hypothetical protein
VRIAAIITLKAVEPQRIEDSNVSLADISPVDISPAEVGMLSDAAEGQRSMKHSLALTPLFSVGLLLLGCSGEDSEPAPVAQMNPLAPAGEMSPGAAPSNEPAAAPAAETDPGAPPSGAAPGGSEEQPAAGAPLAPPMGETPGTGSAGAAAMPDMSAGGAPAVPPAPELTIDRLVGDLDGHLFTMACADVSTADQCNNEGWRSSRNPAQLNTCVGELLDAQINFPIGGDPGVVYDVRMHFYGVTEARNYGPVVTRETAGRPNLNAGGVPTPFASMVAGAGDYRATDDDHYNTYELHVLDDSQQEVAIYFLNADTQIGHYSMGIDYEKSIPLIGGGALLMRVVDSNCVEIKNCSAVPGGPCANKAQVIDVSAADPQPVGLQQPGLGKDRENSGQWFMVDVVGFEPAQ